MRKLYPALRKKLCCWTHSNLGRWCIIIWGGRDSLPYKIIWHQTQCMYIANSYQVPLAEKYIKSLNGCGSKYFGEAEDLQCFEISFMVHALWTIINVQKWNQSWSVIATSVKYFLIIKFQWQNISIEHFSVRLRQIKDLNMWYQLFIESCKTVNMSTLSLISLWWGFFGFSQKNFKSCVALFFSPCAHCSQCHVTQKFYGDGLSD